MKSFVGTQTHREDDQRWKKEGQLEEDFLVDVPSLQDPRSNQLRFQSLRRPFPVHAQDHNRGGKNRGSIRVAAKRWDPQGSLNEVCWQKLPPQVREDNGTS